MAFQRQREVPPAEEGELVDHRVSVRVNKITTTSTSKVSDTDSMGVEYVAQKDIVNAKKKGEGDQKKQVEGDAELAKQLQEQLKGLDGSGSASGAAGGASGNWGMTSASAAQTATPTSTSARGVALTVQQPPKTNASKVEEIM